MDPFAAITDRRMGLELEFVVPVIGTGETRDVQELLARILTNQGIPSHVRPYSHAMIPVGFDLCVEHDSSLTGDTRYSGITWAQVEVKTRPMTYPEVARVLPPALDVIRYLGARITTSCGFHVHHDLSEIVERPQIARNLQHLWWRYHRVMYGMVAPSRHNNRYCRPPERDQATRFDNCRTYELLCQRLTRCDRHVGLNLTNVANPSRRTVEWRLHGGTIEWPKVKNWVLATQRWVEHACQRSCQYRPVPSPNARSGLDALLLSTGLRPNSRIYAKVDTELRTVGRYLLRRWKHFNGQSEESQNANGCVSRIGDPDP
ncbi:MAG TPA: amidoligase family protein [Phycisphaerae bacterium]|nr:amidoligase family protein [Phycisphaerae bacterium]